MNPLKLPFDQYQRYRIVADAIGGVREDGKRLAILDVGGAPGLIRDFLPGDEIIVLDRTGAKAGGFVRGDGAALPFKDRALDVVVSVDVLEHIEPEAREAFIGEMKRVARDYVFIAAPFREEAVEEAERVLFDVMKATKGEEHAFLKEHLEHGLPVEAEVREAMEAGGWESVSVPNGALKRWLPMMALVLYMSGDRFLGEVAGRVNAFYNGNYYEDDNREPSYRRLVAAARGGFRGGAVEGIKGLASRGKPRKELDLSWLSLFITLFGEREMKKAWEAERAEFGKVIEQRERHIRSLKETVAKKDRRIKALEALERSIGVKALKRLGLTKKP